MGVLMPPNGICISCWLNILSIMHDQHQGTCMNGQNMTGKPYLHPIEGNEDIPNPLVVNHL
jgi:hypothetical protein